ncbi:MAG: hypothetical protein KKF12_10205 [Proteobacteria bacterium]|nr:hypothetical protein [Desulfobacula sp.]MBU3954487.1 hypothetical protein [Pseudomonadota bacterium]MBU4131179.1 hypothetical protein [Pseudomonadota bacterium]
MATQKTKTESKFYVAKTIAEMKDKIEKKVKTYNEKFVKKQIKAGREFFTELKADPVKRIDDLIDEGKDTLKKAKTVRMENIQKKVDTTKGHVRKKIDKINLETKKVYKGIGNDAKLIVDDFIAMGKKNLDKLPMKKTIEKKFSAGINAIPSKLNLPSKDEIENLVMGIDGVSKKVDALNKQFADA